MTKAPKTLASLAMDDAVNAVKGADSAVWKATVALGLIMANSQIEAIDSDKPIDESKNKATFRAFLKQFAFRGQTVWRDSQHIVARVMAEPVANEKRRKAASDYVDGGKNANDLFAKPDGARLVDGLARLRTFSFKLMADVLTNHSDILRELRGLRDAGADAVALKERFESFVRSTYGATWAELSSYFTSAKSKPDVDAVDSIVKRAKDMTDSDLSRLVASLQAVWTERMAAAADVESEFGESDDAAETVGQADALEVEAELDRRVAAAA